MNGKISPAFWLQVLFGCLLAIVLLDHPARAQSVVAEWLSLYDSPSYPGATPKAVARDDAGNVYVAGYIAVVGSSYDFVTIKYGPDGSRLWTAVSDGLQYKVYRPIEVGVDPFGNVYVTGSIQVGITNVYIDYVTIKYDPDGNELWVAQYNGPGNGEDIANAQAVDGFGNVYVTGQSDGIFSGEDYATIKYDPDGNRLWVARFNGPSNDYDVANALTVDGSGNVYVTGVSAAPVSGHDYATIKYDPDGNELWVARYDTGQAEYGRVLTLDTSGNVYVGGWAGVVKYDTDGNELWVVHYDWPGQYSGGLPFLVVDSSANLYLTGYMQRVSPPNDYDFVTAKFDPNGNEIWKVSYNGPADDDDLARALAVDGSGNVYVAGTSGGEEGDPYATIMYDPDGNELSAFLYGSHEYNTVCGLDDLGNFYVSQTSSAIEMDATNFTTAAYDVSGSELWSDLYEAPPQSGGGGELCSTIALDASGNVHVTGTCGTWPERINYCTIKYGPAGSQLWVASYDGPGHLADQAADIAVDQSGNVYVTGTSEGEDSQDDYATIKYDSSGNETWIARYNGPGNGTDEAYSVAVDDTGNVYVTGKSEGDFATIKYAPDGSEHWVARDDAAGRGMFVDLDPSGNVYVAGLGTILDKDNVCITIKYDPDGNMLWTASTDEQTYSDTPHGFAVDGSGNVYVACSYGGTIKYDTDGNPLWVVPKWSQGYPRSLEVDTSGNVYVAGGRKPEGGLLDYMDFYTVKYGPDGAELWSAEYPGNQSLDEYVAGLAVDGDGNAYITGYVYSAGTAPNAVTIRYDTDGNQIWAATYGTIFNAVAPVAVKVDTVGKVYIAGTILLGPTGPDNLFTIKYGQTAPAWGALEIAGPGSPSGPSSFALNCLAILLLPLFLMLLLRVRKRTG